MRLKIVSDNPSAILSATLPVKPSVTTTSVLGLSNIVFPSIKLKFLKRGDISPAAILTRLLPFSSSSPTFKREIVGSFFAVMNLENDAPMIAKSLRCSGFAFIVAPKSRKTTFSPLYAG